MTTSALEGLVVSSPTSPSLSLQTIHLERTRQMTSQTLPHTGDRSSARDFVWPIGTISWVTGAPIHDPVDKLILMYLCTGPAESDNPDAVYLHPSVAPELAMTEEQLLHHVENLQARGWLSRFFVEPSAVEAGPWWVIMLDPRKER